MTAGADPTAAVARRFHDLTSHAPGRPSRGGAMRWEERPLPTELVRGVETVPLPRDWPRDARPSDLAGLARLLFLAAGVDRLEGRGQQAMWFRTYPSAGALYPNEVHVACVDVDGLPAGLYHYEPVSHRLDRLRSGDVRGQLARACADDRVATAPLVLVVTGIPWRTTWKYGPRGYRHVFWDAGTLLANATAVAASLDLDVQVVMGFDDAEVSRVLGLASAPFLELAVAVAAVGTTEPPAAAGGEVPALDLDVVPLSPRVADEPELAEVHRAGDLAGPEEVADWRRRMRAAIADRQRAWAPARVEDVILRRGSTRRFDPGAAVPEAALRSTLDAALEPPGSDTGLAALDAYVTVHAVDDVEPAAYRWSAAGPDRVDGPLGDAPVDDLRRAAAHLCLDQPLGGTSAYTAFLCADLGRLLAAGGARAYRTVMLAGGLAAGRIQLAAFAAGIGGTGLTFYDGEVSRAFGTDAEPVVVVAAGRPGYDARPGRRPTDLPAHAVDPTEWRSR